jgi:hypothetical protein
MGRKRTNKKSGTSTVDSNSGAARTGVTPLRPAETAKPKQASKATAKPVTSSAKSTASKPAAAKRAAGKAMAKLTEAQIAKRAHALWVKAGCKHGQDKDHWYEAEAQLKAELGIK